MPGYTGATDEVPPPPSPYYDPDLELDFPAVLACGHDFSTVLNTCESCAACNTVYATLLKNRERARTSFRNGPQARPSPTGRTGEKEARPTGPVGGKGSEKGKGQGSFISSRSNAPGSGSRYAINRSGDHSCWREKELMGQGKGPGCCDKPNCPWKHVNDPPDPGVRAAPVDSGVPDPETWPVCKHIVDPTTYGACPEGRNCRRSHCDMAAAIVRKQFFPHARRSNSRGD